MIRGYFVQSGGPRRPFVDAIFEFPPRSGTFEVRLPVDTGADRTILSPMDARRLGRELGFDIETLARGDPRTGVGGHMETRIIDATLTLDTFSTALSLCVLDPGSELRIPSLLGRDIVSRFALIVEQRADRVLLLEPQEADALHLP